MKTYQIFGPPAPTLARALSDFEAQFTYPLGPGKFFRISHGEDITLFFQAQGKGTCFLAEEQGRLAGAVGTAIRPLWMPDGTESVVAYIGDLKIAKDARGGMVLLRLARAAEAWLRPKVEAAFGIVMGGTPLTPDAYTGRAGIPKFRDLGQVTIFRISGGIEILSYNADRFLTTRESVLGCYRRLSLGRYACCPAGETLKRSQITPVWLMNPDGSACGMLEDTREAKRLLAEDGSEMLSAHLSCFAYSAVASGAALISIALRQASLLGLPALFVAVADQNAAQLRAMLRNVEVLAVSATIYGAGLVPGVWNINSSEI